MLAVTEEKPDYSIIDFKNKTHLHCFFSVDLVRLYKVSKK